MDSNSWTHLVCTIFSSAKAIFPYQESTVDMSQLLRHAISLRRRDWMLSLYLLKQNSTCKFSYPWALGPLLFLWIPDWFLELQVERKRLWSLKPQNKNQERWGWRVEIGEGREHLKLAFKSIRRDCSVSVLAGLQTSDRGSLRFCTGESEYPNRLPSWKGGKTLTLNIYVKFWDSTLWR
jgi:hypothetical protein